MRDAFTKALKSQQPDKEKEPEKSNKAHESIEAQWLRRAEGEGGGQRRGDPRGTSTRGPIPEVPVCLGFDFGTSCSKVVVQVQAPRFATAIVFPQGEKHGLPCLLPTRLFVSTDGRTSISPMPGVPPVVEIKRSLMFQPYDELQLGSNRELRARPVELAAAYIGHAVAFSKAAFRATSNNKLPEGASCRWSANIGIPARTLDEATTGEAFLVALRAGWALSEGGTDITLATSRAAVIGVRSGQFANGVYENLHTIPEVTAEATGYARSSMRQYGTHLMVDVGATTLDACLFLLFDRDGEYCYSLLDANVDPDLGAIGLQERRMEEVAAILTRTNPFLEVPDSAQKYLAMASKAEGLESVDLPFREDCVVMLQAVVARAKKKARKELAAFSNTHGGRTQAADSCVRVILCGGGARLALYREALEQVAASVGPGGTSGLSVKAFEFVGPLPSPPILEMPTLMAPHYDRLAVAYGLSFTLENIGHFTPPSQISDEPPLPVRIGADMTTKDVV